MTDTTDDIAEEISFQSFEDDCKLLGNLLHDVLHREVGSQFMAKIERIRLLAQSASNMRLSGIEDMAELLEKQLASEISEMTLEEALKLARAFSHYLALMGIAETYHRVRKGRSVTHLSKSCDDIFSQLIQGGVTPDELYDTVCKQEVEIVLTAHPTQINRRTLQYKHIRIAHLLEYNDRPDLAHEDREMLIEDLVREITSIWQTDELRRHKPTPVDEARAGLNIVEQSLWKAVPHYLRRVSHALKKVTRDVSLLSRWMAIDLYIREIDSLRFELSMNRCNHSLSRLAQEILEKETLSENLHDSRNQPLSRSLFKHHGQQAPPLPTQLPDRADFPACTVYNDGGGSQYPKLELPGTDYMPLTREDGRGKSSSENSSEGSGLKIPKVPENGSSTNSNGSTTGVTRSFSSSQLLAQRKLFAESTIGRSSFHKLLESSSALRPGIAPYRIILGDVKEKLMKTRRRLELLLEDLPSEYDPWDYYETKDQFLEPLLICYESLQSCGAGILADGRLADLIRRVSTFGMVLMKLDLQESGRHAETLDAITRYLDMGTYSEWEEEKKLEFLTKELKGKRPLVPPTIEVKMFQKYTGVNGGFLRFFSTGMVCA
ncbi:hypothetical protein V6N13_096639 [Hibiscus sabdariffa]